MTRFQQKSISIILRNTGIYQTSPKSTKSQDLISIPVRVTKSYARKQRNIAVSEFLFIRNLFSTTYLPLVLKITV